MSNSEKIINPQRYHGVELQTLAQQQTVERAWSHSSGIKVTKEGIINGFSEEVMELRAELFNDEGREEEKNKINQLGLASEVADHILYILGIASHYHIDFESEFINAHHLKKENFDLANYCPNQVEVNFSACQKSSAAILDILMHKEVAVDRLKPALLQHYENMAALAGHFELSLTEIVSQKINRNYHKYANLKQHLLSGKTSQEARQMVKKEWQKEEDERFMQSFFIDYIKPDDYPEISQMVHLNFDAAPNYNSLSFDQKMAYKKANTEEETKNVCEHPDNVLALVARSNNAQRIIMGYVVVRHKKDDQKTAMIKRFHVHLEMTAKQIGQKLLRATEALLKQQDFQYLEVGASGASSDWFRKQGFDNLEVVVDTSGVFLGTDLETIKRQMLKVL